MLQFHIATESTKFGLQLKEAKEILDSDEFKRLQNIKVSGVMGMASFVENESQVRLEFATLKSIFEELKSSYFASADSFKTVSMGMSGDYSIAIEEGSTMIRVGSSIFGTRN